MDTRLCSPSVRVVLNLFLAFCFAASPSLCTAQVTVPEAPPPDAKSQLYKDGHFGVRFKVPEGWTLYRKDGEVSTFHLDARSASPHAQLRSVLSIQFNPYPYSTFSGALFYFSVEPHTTDAECAHQATAFGRRTSDAPVSVKSLTDDLQDIGGMNFVHGHDEHGQICVEARDEVYTAYRKGACYRFDLAMNNFCSISSGAVDLTESQLQHIDQQMTNILSTVTLDWTKAGPHPVPVPKLPPMPVVVPPGSHTAMLQAPEQPATRAHAPLNR